MLFAQAQVRIGGQLFALMQLRIPEYERHK